MSKSSDTKRNNLNKRKQRIIDEYENKCFVNKLDPVFVMSELADEYNYSFLTIKGIVRSWKRNKIKKTEE